MLPRRRAAHRALAQKVNDLIQLPLLRLQGSPTRLQHLRVGRQRVVLDAHAARVAALPEGRLAQVHLHTLEVVTVAAVHLDDLQAVTA